MIFNKLQTDIVSNYLQQMQRYDLSPANEYLYTIGMGLHHSGVEILGREYSFASGGGIFDSSPKEAPGAQFREALELGTFDGGSAELQSAISGELILLPITSLFILRNGAKLSHTILV